MSSQQCCEESSGVASTLHSDSAVHPGYQLESYKVEINHVCNFSNECSYPQTSKASTGPPVVNINDRKFFNGGDERIVRRWDTTDKSTLSQERTTHAVCPALQVVTPSKHNILIRSEAAFFPTCLSCSSPAMIARKEWRKADFQLIELLHKGYASHVYKAVSKHGLGSVALKVYNMDKLEELQRYQVYREIRIHSQVQHTNLIRLLLAFQEGNEVVLVQELAEDGDLFELLREHQCGEEMNSGGVRLPEDQAVELVIHPLLRALHNLHTRGIMHRDIKTENIVFKNGVMKLADFGLAINMREESPVTRAGTLDYMAPEVVRCPRKAHPMENKDDHGLHYGPGADVWAVGVLSFELITGCVPFSGSNSKESVGRILSRNPSFPSHVSESARSFILQALMKHPRDRASVLELLHHPWVQSLQHRASLSRKSSLLSTSLKTSPSSTLGDSPFSSGTSNIFNERNSPDYKPPAMFTSSSHSPRDDTGLPSSLSNAASSGTMVCSDTDGLDGGHPSPVLLQGSRDQGTPTKSEGSTLADVKPCPLVLSHTRSSSLESSSLLAVSGDETNPDTFSSKKKCMRQLPTSFSMFLAEGTASEGSSVAVSQSRLQSSNIIGRTPREIAEMISQLVLRRLSSSKLTLTSRAGSMAADS